ncbi:MAG: hypothetical protein FWH16_04890 [Oscillospiraceae bacterium]|nr:hypothetical protein [Oscillospiraceae bacterium]
MNGFFKGVGMGVIAGAMITMSVVPVDRRRMMRSPMGRKVSAVCDFCEGIKDAF